eukprot:2417576-Rhodomonas_salina.1
MHTPPIPHCRYSPRRRRGMALQYRARQRGTERGCVGTRSWTLGQCSSCLLYTSPSPRDRG